MPTRLASLVLIAAVIAGGSAPAFAQSKIPGAPSNAPPIGVDVTAKAEAIGDKIENVFENLSMYTNYMRQEQIKGTLERYLTQIDAKPTAGQVHLFYVQALVGDKGYVELKDFQYLTHGKTTVDALRESFVIDGGPGTEDRLDATSPGTRLEGVYVSARPVDGKFEITGGSLTKEFYEKVRKEGMALREQGAKERAEAERIQQLRRQRTAVHQGPGDAAARAQIQRDLARGPTPPGPVIFPSGAPVGRGDATSLPPTRSGSQPTMTVTPIISLPKAHPRVQFNATPTATPPAPVQTQPLR